jgi:hypothetical protein
LIGFVVCAEEPRVLDLDGTRAMDLADDAGDGIRVAGAVERGAGIVEVDAREGRREAIRVALAPDLAVRHDVEAGRLLGADREQGRVLLGFLEPRVGNAPELPGAHARGEPRREPGAVDQPLGLRIAADERRRKQRHRLRRSPFTQSWSPIAGGSGTSSAVARIGPTGVKESNDFRVDRSSSPRTVMSITPV